MITKNEAEGLMDQAIGMKIDDYLLKPINPLQIFSAVKRVLEAHSIQEGAASKDYLEVFRRIDDLVSKGPDLEEWARIHLDLCQWDLEFDRFSGTGMGQIHVDLRKRCNVDFARYVEENYESWISADDGPVMSVDVMKDCVFPHLNSKKQVYFIVIDCMRYDQWLTVEDLIAPFFNITREWYCAILPTATPYARNAIFSGLYPADIARLHPEMWLERSKDELSKNRYEDRLMEEMFKRARMGHVKTKYAKIYNTEEANEIRKQVDTWGDLDVVAMVFNFLDILAHGRSQSDILQEIAPNESAFRSLMRSWFSHSALLEILRKISRLGATAVITTDHGSILGQKASLVHGNRETSTNLRYKFGENINGDPKQSLLIRRPADFRLPAEGPAKNYILARENYYFVYPTRFHEYEKQYQGTFQHGGISLEEMIVPCITMTPR
jgi:hypothetical protein